MSPNAKRRSCLFGVDSSSFIDPKRKRIRFFSSVFHFSFALSSMSFVLLLLENTNRNIIRKKINFSPNKQEKTQIINHRKILWQIRWEKRKFSKEIRWKNTLLLFFKTITNGKQSISLPTSTSNQTKVNSNSAVVTTGKPFYYDNLDDIPFIDESRPTSVVDITQV